jgi:hypothetical protein
LLSAITAAVLSLIGVLILTWNPSGAPFALTDIRFLSVFLLTLLVLALLGLTFVALPLTFVLSRLKAERVWVYPAFGFLTGYAVALGFSELPLRGWDWGALAFAAGLPGALAGWVWWIKYRRIASAGQRA